MTAAEEISDEGLTLWDAFERYRDPEAWRAYKAAAAQVPPWAPPIMSFSMAPHLDHWDGRSDGMDYATYVRLKRQRHRLWHAVVSDFLQKLRRGELVGRGYVHPRRLGDEPDWLKPEDWSWLRANLKRSVLKGDGYELRYVRVWPAAAAEAVIEAALKLEDEDLPIGRPTRLKEIRDELLRRVKAGEQKESLRAECRYLANWINKKHHRHIYKSRSLEQPMRAHYVKPERKNK